VIACLGRFVDRVGSWCDTERADQVVFGDEPGGSGDGWVDRIADFCQARIPTAVVAWCSVDDEDDDIGH
jgi:hypothetical protein